MSKCLRTISRISITDYLEDLLMGKTSEDVGEFHFWKLVFIR